MFELNNLAVQVQSPIELFFLAVDDLPEERQEPVQAITQPWLDALDTDYDVCCTVHSPSLVPCALSGAAG